MSEPKIALALIVKGADNEADPLARCLANISPHVDGIFVTITRNEGCDPSRVEGVANMYNANISWFDWVNDFAAARNYNFAQVPKEYTHILWADADDVFRGLDKLRPTLKKHFNVDAFSTFYMYDFDEYKQPTVVHMKTQILKNNGSVEWAGRLHEDFKENRSIRRHFIKGIERMHLTDEQRLGIARERNITVAEADVEANPNDPRSYWNLGNSLFAAGKGKEARQALDTFLTLSNSDDEKYATHMRLAAIESTLGDNQSAIDHLRYAIGLKPAFPDAYHQLGQLFHNMKRYQDAVEMITQGLARLVTEEKPYHKVIVYNPRDYDYNPLMLLGKTFFMLSRPDQALTCLEACLKIQPKNEGLKKIIKEMKKETKKFDKVTHIIAELKDVSDKEILRQKLAKIPKALRSHPAIALVRNTHFIKEESSGRDLVIYCGMTEFEWDAETAKTKMVGGSEEAVINLSKEFHKRGWKVTVYNNCGHLAKKIDGVTWKPFWEWNYRDRQDVVIIWRQPMALDYPINAPFVGVDMHDVIPPGEFTPERIERMTKVFFKTDFHRSLFPHIPEEKCVVIPNGMDFDLFDQEVTKDQYLMVNTSSPDRSLDVLPKLFKMVKERVPQARCKWAYGWDIFDIAHSSNAKMMEWKAETIKAMEEAGIETVGRIPQKECAKLYLEGNILAYPTEFAEIDCITVKKAQACGCVPVTTDFGALDTSVQYGVKVHSTKTKDTWSRDFQFHFGLEDERAQQEWVDAVVKILQTPIEDRTDMKEWTKKFAWTNIADAWHTVIHKE